MAYPHEIFNYQVCKSFLEKPIGGFEPLPLDFGHTGFLVTARQFLAEIFATTFFYCMNLKALLIARARFWASIIEKATTTTKMAFLTVEEAQFLIQHNLIVEHGQLKDRGEFECMFCKVLFDFAEVIAQIWL